MQTLCETARFLSSCNVLDIYFENGSTLEVYVAASPEQRSAGLANVASIDLDGMLFVYDTPSYVPFTMQKMQMDLDIAWYDRAGTLIQLASYQAGFSDPIFCPKPFTYVLEAPKGTLSEVNLKVRNGS